MKKVLPIIVALVLAAVAALGIANWSRNNAVKTRTMDFVAAGRLLHPGDTIKKEDLVTGTLGVPANTDQNKAIWDYVFANFVSPSNTGQIEGRTVAREVKLGAPVLEYNLKPEQLDIHRADWKTKIENNKRAIAIPVNAQNAVNGLVEVGDHVDIIVTVQVPNKDAGAQPEMTVPMQMGTGTQNVKIPMGGQARQGDPMTFYLLQDIEILSVGSQTFNMDEVDAKDPLAALAARQGAGSNGITVSLDPEDVLMLSFVIAAGDAEFTLALRAGNDPSRFDTTNRPPADFKQLLTKLGVPQP